MDAKQYAAKQPMAQWRNQRGNQKIPRDKWKWKHDNPKPTGCSKSSSPEGSLQQYKLTSGNKKNLKQPNPTPKATRIKNKQNPKLVEEKKS